MDFFSISRPPHKDYFSMIRVVDTILKHARKRPLSGQVKISVEFSWHGIRTWTRQRGGNCGGSAALITVDQRRRWHSTAEEKQENNWEGRKKKRKDREQQLFFAWRLRLYHMDSTHDHNKTPIRSAACDLLKSHAHALIVSVSGASCFRSKERTRKEPWRFLHAGQASTYSFFFSPD